VASASLPTLLFLCKTVVFPTFAILLTYHLTAGENCDTKFLKFVLIIYYDYDNTFLRQMREADL
jgi:hypothetical protein